jgi:hypothetical protein
LLLVRFIAANIVDIDVLVAVGLDDDVLGGTVVGVDVLR